MQKLLSDEEVLEYYGWEVECELPYEIRHMDGSFARDQAAHYLIQGLREDYFEERNENFNIMIESLGKLVDDLGETITEIKAMPIEFQKEIFNPVNGIGKMYNKLGIEFDKLNETLKNSRNETPES